jgi:hypothetical protein
MLLMANIAMAPHAHVHGGYYRAVDLDDVCLFDLPPIPAASATTSAQRYSSRAHGRALDWPHVWGEGGAASRRAPPARFLPSASFCRCPETPRFRKRQAQFCATGQNIPSTSRRTRKAHVHNAACRGKTGALPTILPLWKARETLL